MWYLWREERLEEEEGAGENGLNFLDAERKSVDNTGSWLLETEGVEGIAGINLLVSIENSQGSPRILVWVAYPFSSGSSRPRR